MKTRTVAPLLLVIALLLPFVQGGCASKLEKAYAVRTVFNTALTDLKALREAKAVDDQTFTAAVKAANASAPVLDELDRSALDDNAFSFQTAYGKARERVNEFLTWVARARTKH
jgi:hypothetical protein